MARHGSTPVTALGGAEGGRAQAEGQNGLYSKTLCVAKRTLDTEPRTPLNYWTKRQEKEVIEMTNLRQELIGLDLTSWVRVTDPQYQGSCPPKPKITSAFPNSRHLYVGSGG